jgi:AraC-like DNA-binding protein
MDPRISSVIRSMEADIDGRLTVTALAAAVNLSPSRLTALFRCETGVSPLRYLRALRMERARLLLERTFLSVKEVMAFVGVNDPSHFTRDFRRYHGVAPSRLRDRSWARDPGRGGEAGQQTRETANEPSSAAAAGAGIVDGIIGEGPTTNRTPRRRRTDGHGENN